MVPLRSFPWRGYGSNVPNDTDSASPLTSAELIAVATAAGVELGQVVTMESVESTNDEALSLAEQGAPQWTVVTAEYQTGGRGRLDRSWESRTGDGLLFSVIVRPPSTLPVQSYGWVPLIAGVAVARALNVLGVPARLKWPNDVVVDGDAADGSPGPRKLAGLLAERHGDAIIVGIGVNVLAAQADLPIPAATSVVLEGGQVSRVELLCTTLAPWQQLWSDFVSANGDADASGLLESYSDLCLTLGRRVRADIMDRAPVVGVATGVDSCGHLVVESDLAKVVVSAGDVNHLR